MSKKWFDGKIRPRIIGFCGYARSGKNTAAEELSKILMSEFDLQKIQMIGFADPLKENLFPLIELCERQGYETKSPEFKEMFRPMYVEWSKVYKNITNNNKIWCEMAMKRISDSIYPLTMITDVRYVYEIEEIRKSGGVVIYLHKPNVQAANTEEYYSFGEIMYRYKNSFKGKDDSILFVKNDGTKRDLGINCYEILTKKGII